MLQVADAAMNHLEAFRGSAAAEVAALDERGAQAEQCCFSRCCGAEGSTADDENIELSFSQLRGISVHCSRLAQKPARCTFDADFDARAPRYRRRTYLHVTLYV